MCLAMPVKLVEICGVTEAKPHGNGTAIVDAAGVRKTISTELLDEVRAGDYVILHAGFALSRLDPEEAEQTLALFDELLARDDTKAAGT